MKSTFLYSLAFYLAACAGSSNPTDNQHTFFDLPDWRGQPIYKIEQDFGVDGIHTPLPLGKHQLKIEQIWVLGAGGERYKTLQKDYAVRGATAGKASGGFNATVLHCSYLFEWGPDQVTERAYVNNRKCPAPRPSI